MPLRYPIWTLVMVLIMIGFVGYNAPKLQIDASSKTLILEHDKDLQYTREVQARYHTPDFLVVTYSPKTALLSKESLETISQLSQKLQALPMVTSVTSLLNVPLLQSPPKPVKELLAKKEFLKSPLYQNNLVSEDFKTTALLVNLIEDAPETDRDIQREKEHQNIKNIRAIMHEFQEEGELFLGGVSMIADDMITYVKSDLFIYGTTVILLMIVVLWIVFRQIRFIAKIKNDLGEKPTIESDNVHLSNLMILYNNMLRSLFDSQIRTLGIMVSALTLMFFLLFKSAKLAFIAMVANIIPIATVFGLMGWANIPLDMMTITIAAISIGIGVDDTIHYIHRYALEIKKDGDYKVALQRSHESIGYAMYYTTFAIMIGFSVLVLSNFLPTIYFGLLTVFAVFMALTADLLLLPRLILLLKPFKV